MAGFKNNRQNEDIKRELSALIRDTVKDPRVDASSVSVVRTELSGDGSVCKVYVSSLNGLDAAKNAVKGLESASGLLRRAIGGKLEMRKCPEFRFIADDSIEYSAKISKLFNEEK